MLLVESSLSTQDYQTDSVILRNESSSVVGPYSKDVDTSFQDFFTVLRQRSQPIIDSPYADYTSPTSPAIQVESSPKFSQTMTLDVFDEILDEFEQKYRAWKELCQAYRRRIEILRKAGATEGIKLNKCSEEDFWLFLRSPMTTRQAGLALMDNGNIRAVWRDDDSNHLGLHFLGGREIRYVIFKRQPDSEGMFRTAGSDDFEGMEKKIDEFDLTPLLNP